MTNDKSGFCLSRAAGARFEPTPGYRDWSGIRDLDPGGDTHGENDARLARANQLGDRTWRHCHRPDFQIMYVRHSRVKTYHEAAGEFVPGRDDILYLPPGRALEFVEYYEDIDTLEPSSPVDHSAIDV